MPTPAEQDRIRAECGGAPEDDADVVGVRDALEHDEARSGLRNLTPRWGGVAFTDRETTAMDVEAAHVVERVLRHDVDRHLFALRQQVAQPFARRRRHQHRPHREA